MELIYSQARKGRTVIMVTHNLELARRADCVLKLRDGRLLEAVVR
jgi:putative ABC transport system ATP-binding protein